MNGIDTVSQGEEGIEMEKFCKKITEEQSRDISNYLNEKAGSIKEDREEERMKQALIAQYERVLLKAEKEITALKRANTDMQQEIIQLNGELMFKGGREDEVKEDENKEKEKEEASINDIADLLYERLRSSILEERMELTEASLSEVVLPEGFEYSFMGTEVSIKNKSKRIFMNIDQDENLLRITKVGMQSWINGRLEDYITKNK